MNEGIPRQERNIELDKDNFIEAISSVNIEEIPASFDDTAVEKLANTIEETGVFILGEMHGVKENVDVVYTLFKKFDFRKLALEWGPAVGEMVNRFTETGELDFSVIEGSPDGRVTAGHLVLIKKLIDEGLLEKLVCFDGSSADTWNERDANMAKTIIDNLSDAPTLVVAGNLHAKTEPITFDDDPDEHYPMASIVKSKIPNTPSGKIDYLSGSYHNYGPQEFCDVLSLA